MDRIKRSHQIFTESIAIRALSVFFTPSSLISHSKQWIIQKNNPVATPSGGSSGLHQAHAHGSPSLGGWPPLPSRAAPPAGGCPGPAPGSAQQTLPSFSSGSHHLNKLLLMNSTDSRCPILAEEPEVPWAIQGCSRHVSW